MKFKRRVRVDSGLRQIDIAPLIDCVFLLLIFFMLTSNFVMVPGVNVKLPKTLTSEKINAQTLTIVISSEDIIYLDGKVATIKEVEALIKKSKAEGIFIKADKDASLGAVVEIWDICKTSGVEKIGIATAYEE